MKTRGGDQGVLDGHFKLLSLIVSGFILHGLVSLIFGTGALDFIQLNYLADFGFILIAILHLRKTQNSLGSYLFSFLLLLYTIAVNILSQLNHIPFFESLRATKWLILVSILILVNPKGQLPKGSIEKILKPLLILCLPVYLITQFRSGFTSRPFLFIENNYELLFISILMLGMYWNSIHENRVFSFRWLIIYVVVSVASLSLSGVLMATLVTFYIARKQSKYDLERWLALTLFGLVAFLIFLTTVFYRINLSKSIDRLYFLNLFMMEMHERGISSWFFPSLYIKPLSTYTCSGLTPWYKLFNEIEQLSCFSVIFHSFILRAITDFGILFFLTVMSLFYRKLRSSLDKEFARMLIGIILLNSLSVSGFNSSFCFLGLLIVILQKRSVLDFPTKYSIHNKV